MVDKEQWTVVTTIAEDDGLIEEKAREMSGEGLKIDGGWFEDSVMADLAEDVGAVLLKTDGKKGAMRLTGPGIDGGVKDFDTGRTKNEYWLIIVASGQRLTCLGDPAFRTLRRPSGLPRTSSCTL